MPTVRQRGWALFFGVFASAFGLFVLVIGFRRHGQESPLAGLLVGGAALALGLRLCYAAFTGRMPEWIASLADAD